MDRFKFKREVPIQIYVIERALSFSKTSLSA